MLFWELDFSLVSLLSSLCPSSGIASLFSSTVSSHLLPSRLHRQDSLFAPLFNSESLLVLFLSPPACQSLLVTKWFVGALRLDNFFCLALPLSLPPSSSSLSLVPVTLLERAALRPGNEGNGRSVKHLLFNRADFCPHQEARNWTCLITDFRSITSVTLRCLQPRQWWYVNKVLYKFFHRMPTTFTWWIKRCKPNHVKELSHLRQAGLKIEKWISKHWEPTGQGCVVHCSASGCFLEVRLYIFKRRARLKQT